MTLLRETKRRQRDWAARRSIEIDQYGYVLDDRKNLFLPLSPTFLAALGDAGGGELQDQRDRPAKIRALHSSAVLAINVFQYWEGRSGEVLPRALGLEGSQGHWAACGLPGCQRLAETIAAGDEPFRHLDALQLLKHALGLRKSAGQPVSLCYLYFDYGQPSDIADRHRSEIVRFAECIDDDVGFRALSYQSLFAALSDSAGIDESYIGYLGERYF